MLARLGALGRFDMTAGTHQIYYNSNTTQNYIIKSNSTDELNVIKGFHNHSEPLFCLLSLLASESLSLFSLQ